MLEVKVEPTNEEQSNEGQRLNKLQLSGAQRFLKLNVKKTKRMTIRDVPVYITIQGNNTQLER